MFEYHQYITLSYLNGIKDKFCYLLLKMLFSRRKLLICAIDFLFAC